MFNCAIFNSFGYLKTKNNKRKDINSENKINEIYDFAKIINSYEIINCSEEELIENLKKVRCNEELIELIKLVKNGTELNQIISSEKFRVYANNSVLQAITQSDYAGEISLDNIFQISALANKLIQLVNLSIATNAIIPESIELLNVKMVAIFSTKNLNNIINHKTTIEDLEMLIQLPPIQRLSIDFTHYSLDDFLNVCELILTHHMVGNLSKNSLMHFRKAIKEEIKIFCDNNSDDLQENLILKQLNKFCKAIDTIRKSQFDIKYGKKGLTLSFC